MDYLALGPERAEGGPPEGQEDVLQMDSILEGGREDQDGIPGELQQDHAGEGAREGQEDEGSGAGPRACAKQGEDEKEPLDGEHWVFSPLLG